MERKLLDTTNDDKAPERILADQDNLTWVENYPGETKRAHEVEYIRADLHDATQARIAELEGGRRARHANPGVFRYWEGRLRDEVAENDQLRADNERLRGMAVMAGRALESVLAGKPVGNADEIIVSCAALQRKEGDE